MTKKISVTELRNNLVFEFDSLSENKTDRLIIKRRKGNIIMLSLKEFNSIEETLYLLSSKKNRDYIFESIRQGEKIKSK